MAWSSTAQRYRWRNWPSRSKNSHPVKTFVLPLVAFFLAAPFLSAQENYGTIHVITKVMPDKSQVTTKMDPDSRTAEETVTDAANKVLKKTIYNYDENNVAVSATFYDAKGNATHKAAYTRDGAGRITEVAFSLPDGRYIGKRVYVYTGTTANKASQVIDYDADGKQTSVAQAAEPKSGKKSKR